MTSDSAPNPGGSAIPARCGVVGGGRMGAGIAHALLLAGAEVVVLERDAAAAAAARERVAGTVRRSAERGQVTDPAAVLERLITIVDAGALSGAALVVEAVPEDRDLKLATLRRIEDVVTADCVIASNTSSISLAELGQALAHPERLLGLHFFNPVPASKLVEVVIAPATDPSLRERAAGWVRQLGKAAVVVRASPATWKPNWESGSARPHCSRSSSSRGISAARVAGASTTGAMSDDRRDSPQLSVRGLGPRCGSRDRRP
jgi:3-hydroxybutyryl-CoA dehydrogenase